MYKSRGVESKNVLSAIK